MISLVQKKKKKKVEVEVGDYVRRLQSLVLSCWRNRASCRSHQSYHCILLTTCIGMFLFSRVQRCEGNLVDANAPGKASSSCTTMALYPEAAKRFLTFINASPTPFHAVHNAGIRLETAGFRKVLNLILELGSRSHDACRSEK